MRTILVFCFLLCGGLSAERPRPLGFGIAHFDMDGGDDRLTRMLLTRDQKILLVGSVTMSWSGSHSPQSAGFPTSVTFLPSGRDVGAVRLLPSGALDGTFATGGRFHFDFNEGEDEATTATELPNGGFLLAGTSQQGGHTHAFIIELTADGTLKSRWQSSTAIAGLSHVAHVFPKQVFVQPSGRYVLVGNAADTKGRFAFALELTDLNSDSSAVLRWKSDLAQGHFQVERATSWHDKILLAGTYLGRTTLITLDEQLTRQNWITGIHPAKETTSPTSILVDAEQRLWGVSCSANLCLLFRARSLDTLDTSFGTRGRLRLPSGNHWSDLTQTTEGTIYLLGEKAGGFTLLPLAANQNQLKQPYPLPPSPFPSRSVTLSWHSRLGLLLGGNAQSELSQDFFVLQAPAP